jgi:heterogeneous nuclear ribonucleoprotein R
MGNVPKDWTVEDMKKVVAKVGPGVISVELLKVHQHFFYVMWFDFTCVASWVIFALTDLAVLLLQDPQSSSCNRGFAFIEYHNHACAEYSRQKMSDSKFKLDNNAPTVSWADPRNSESSSSSQVICYKFYT